MLYGIQNCSPPFRLFNDTSIEATNWHKIKTIFFINRHEEEKIGSTAKMI